MLSLRRRAGRVDRLLGDRDVELCDLPQARLPAGRDRSISARSCSISRCCAAWSALYYGINYYLLLEEEIDQRAQLESQASSAQLAMLRYQLNPHFLFNTLNSISTLVLLKQTERANAMLARLSSFLRYTLANEPTAQGDAGAGGGDAEALPRNREDAVRGPASAAFPDRQFDDRRAPAVAAAPAADRKCDQICGHPERNRRRHLDQGRARRGTACGSRSPTAAAAQGSGRQPVLDRRRPGEHQGPSGASLWRRPRFYDQIERSRRVQRYHRNPARRARTRQRKKVHP